MQIRTTIAALVLMGLVSGSSYGGEPLACRVNAFDKSQRERHQTLTKKLTSAKLSSTELSNGYAFSLRRERISLVEVAEWVDLESRCCPFLKFEIELGSGSEPLKLRLTGGTAIKEFLKSEFSSVP